MIIKSVNLETVCGITSKLPENEFSEFAFAGKSNVGKSSLINGLISRKAYARTSAEPGKTQTINYYKVEYREKSQKEIEAQGLDASYAQEKSVYFVDFCKDGIKRAENFIQKDYFLYLCRVLTTVTVGKV